MIERQTEQLHPLGAGLHKKADAEVLHAVLTGQQQALACLQGCFSDLIHVADAGAKALGAGRKLAYAGAGSSGLMALADSLELAGTFGISRAQTPMLFAGGAAALVSMTGGVEDDAEQALADVRRAGIGTGDVVLCLAASGSTPYTLAVAQAARDAGATVAGIANTRNSALFDLSDLTVLLETGPEVVAGSTRLGAATSQKAALNMISVLIGVKLGAVHDGLMVNLIADNIKLVDRAARIVMRVARTDEDTARKSLHLTQGAVKPAILVARGMSVAEAASALAASHGVLAPHID